MSTSVGLEPERNRIMLIEINTSHFVMNLRVDNLVRDS